MGWGEGRAASSLSAWRSSAGTLVEGAVTFTRCPSIRGFAFSLFVEGCGVLFPIETGGEMSVDFPLEVDNIFVISV